jgi:hypothetical protein
MFENATEKSRHLAGHYQAVAEQFGCAFLDTATVIVSSDLDGIHWDESEHRKLGQAVAVKARELLSS